MWVKRNEYEALVKENARLKYGNKNDAFSSQTLENHMLKTSNDSLRKTIAHLDTVLAIYLDSSEDKENQESHKYALICLERAKKEAEIGNVHDATLLFKEYEKHVDYTVDQCKSAPEPGTVRCVNAK